MDQFIFQNTVWFIVLMASVIINWRLGYKQGIIDSYTHTTVPMVEMLIAQGHLSVGNEDEDHSKVDVPALTARLIRLAMLRKAAMSQER
jgi:hypothetical protein